MDDEFALCWNNFQENIATGFQNLYDRGDLVDVTLACDGKLLQAHKIVLAICSPYFQEIFVTNPCKHPIIILKDVTYIVMSELLQFMYQGVVNVKHTDLASFMKIAQALQIKGLTTSMQRPAAALSPALHQSPSSKGSNSVGDSPASFHPNHLSSNVIETKISSALFAAKAAAAANETSSSSGNAPTKRSLDYGASTSGDGLLSIHRKKSLRRSSEGGASALGALSGGGDHDMNESMENMSSDEVFIPPIPQISMTEASRFDLNNVKRESGEASMLSPGSGMRLGPYNFEYNPSMFGGNGGGSGSAASGSGPKIEYPNDLHMNNEFGGKSSGGANHMEIPAGGHITMLSSTSLLHGNCIFNRNNTVATQQGMKTYWLCKSYRITMCRARCITHQGRVISATGVHNHVPHMKGSGGNSSAGGNGGTSNQQSLSSVSLSSASNPSSVTIQHQASVVGSSVDFMNSLIAGGVNVSGVPAGSGRSHGMPSSQHLSAGSAPTQPHHHHHHHSAQPQPSHQQQQHQGVLQQQPASHSQQPMHHSPGGTMHHHLQQQHQSQHQHPGLHHQHHLHHHQTPPSSSHHGSHHGHASTATHSQHNSNAAAIQNMMHNLSQNSLMQLTNINPILNPLQSNHHQLGHIHAPSSLQITPIMNTSHSPTMSAQPSPPLQQQHQHHQHHHQQQQQQPHQQQQQQHLHSHHSQHHHIGQQQQQQQQHHHQDHTQQSSVMGPTTPIQGSVTPNMSIVPITTTTPNAGEPSENSTQSTTVPSSVTPSSIASSQPDDSSTITDSQQHMSDTQQDQSGTNNTSHATDIISSMTSPTHQQTQFKMEHI